MGGPPSRPRWGCGFHGRRLGLTESEGKCFTCIMGTNTQYNRRNVLDQTSQVVNEANVSKFSIQLPWHLAPTYPYSHTHMRAAVMPIVP